MRSLRLSWREARPVVQLIFLLRFLTGALVAAGGLTPSSLAHVAVGALAWLCATWHIYLLNGVCDQVEDRHNGSSRPLATGALPVSTARRIGRLLAITAFGLGALVSWRFVAAVAVIIVLGWLYSVGSRPQKANALGFAVVVISGGVVTYLAGWLAAGSSRPGTTLIVVALAMSLWMGTAGMTKDLSDAAGDRAAGRQTLPVVLGDRTSRLVMAALALAAGGVLLLAAGLAVRSLLPVALLLMLGASAVAVSLLTPLSRGSRGGLRRPYRLFVITQYAVHVAILGGLVH